ncbi:MAG: hypothetical protein L3J59_16470 [Methylococcaceae bacterium]|nr:hypothetical protein [Methylococcaceae bacterium]
MSSKIDVLLSKIQSLEQELILEIQNQQSTFAFEIKQRRIFFEKKVTQQQKYYLQKLLSYLKNSSLKNVLSAPIIWGVLIPAVLLDICVTLFQLICFPIYGIPKVKRADYVIFDRQYLSYLNIIEKINCAYCSYFNGIIAYIQEIAARTEQFWCPIKHARNLSNLHSRYQKFIDYGDAKSYRLQKQEIRTQFDDL